MSLSSFTKRLNKEIQLYQKDNFSFPNLLLKPSDSLDTWYFIIHGLKNTDFDNGIYMGKVLLPLKYPFKAPDFQFLTESGRFEINKKICTSFTGFHNELYSPSWNIQSMCTGLVSFMTDDENAKDTKGIGGIQSSKQERQKIAIKSNELIKNNEIFNKYFKEYYNILQLS